MKKIKYDAVLGAITFVIYVIFSLYLENKLVYKLNAVLAGVLIGIIVFLLVRLAEDKKERRAEQEEKEKMVKAKIKK